MGGQGEGGKREAWTRPLVPLSPCHATLPLRGEPPHASGSPCPFLPWFPAGLLGTRQIYFIKKGGHGWHTVIYVYLIENHFRYCCNFRSRTKIFKSIFCVVIKFLQNFIYTQKFCKNSNLYYFMFDKIVSSY